MIIFDSHYLLHKARHSFPPMEHNGFRTNVIYGFLHQVIHIWSEMKTEDRELAFAFDSARNHRKQVLPTYKQRDHRTPEEERQWEFDQIQFSHTRDFVLPRIGFSRIWFQQGYEADDIIAAVVKSEDLVGWTVVSADEDLYQILNHCRIYNPTRRTFLDAAWFDAEYGIPCPEWALVKAIAGCSSDRIRGVGGVGEGPACEYVRGTLKDGSKKRRIESAEGQEIISRNLLLTKLPYPSIRTPHVPLGSNGTLKQFTSMCQGLGFRSFLQDPVWQMWCDLFQQ